MRRLSRLLHAAWLPTAAFAIALLVLVADNTLLEHNRPAVAMPQECYTLEMAFKDGQGHVRPMFISSADQRTRLALGFIVFALGITACWRIRR